MTDKDLAEWVISVWGKEPHGTYLAYQKTFKLADAAMQLAQAYLELVLREKISHEVEEKTTQQGE